MKCVVGLLFVAVCAMEVISAIPVRNGMVFYQSQPDYYYGSNAHRAFVMQYASQPLRAYRRNGQAAGVSAYASGKKIAAGTYLRSKLSHALHPKCANPISNTDTEQLEDEDQAVGPDGGVQSVATAFDPQADFEDEVPSDIPSNDELPEPVAPVANDEPAEDFPVNPQAVPVPNGNRKTPVAHDEEDEDDEPEERPLRRNRPSAGHTYFPVTFGSTNGGAIAIANSYSTGKGNLRVEKKFLEHFSKSFHPNFVSS
jgi:hypothetical protein